MSFALPKYQAPDFNGLGLNNSEDVKIEICMSDGIAPDNYHSTSMYPEYFKVNGKWILAKDSRMDCCAVLSGDEVKIVELRNIKEGDKIILGRKENGQEGIFIHASGFSSENAARDLFSFRCGRSRETSHARDIDELAELLRYEKENGKIVWVMGPAVAFDERARTSMKKLEDSGYVHGIMAGNALATHDLEASYFHTALGQDIYTQRNSELGHYNHIDIINEVRKEGSISNFVKKFNFSDGIMSGCIINDIPFVLAGSIRDDGPLPEVIGDVYDAQSRMRQMLSNATTVICLASMLHTIASGNMTPSFRVTKDDIVRPVYFYAVDADEFVVNKLIDRGSISARTVVANVQDFVYQLAVGLGL